MGNVAEEPLIVAAPTAFKETLTPLQATDAIARGVRRVLPRARIVRIPVADGGDGTREVLGVGGTTRTARVLDPLGRPTRAPFTLVGTTAVVEMADASGLKLLRQEERDPEKTSTFGTGQLILAAFRAGARRILLGVGGSATVDGGEGALRALEDLRLCRRITVLCDVRTTSLEAPRVFGPQKGATPAAVKRLETRLRGFLPRRVWKRAGSGAAGGLAGGLAAHGAKLVPGADYFLRVLRFRRRIRGARLVLTGEGRFDRTSLAGKIVGAVLRACGRIPCVVLCGRCEVPSVPSVQLETLAGSPDRARREAARWLARAAEVAARSCR